MKVTPTALPEVLVLEPRVFRDARGSLYESFQIERYASAGIQGPFVQENVSHSVRGTLRGLHFQEPRPQGKLVQVLRGRIYDVAVDVRVGSPRFGRWVAVELSDEVPTQLWIPQGFAHGFSVLSEVADVAYKCTALWAPDADRGIAWNDPQIGIAWPTREPLLSDKDQSAPRLADAPVLPRFPGA